MQPSSNAFWFIKFAKFSILPDISSAKIYPTSFAECIKNISNKSFTLKDSPTFIPAFEYPEGIAVIAERLAVNFEVKFNFSIAIIAVKIFVVLAGYNWRFISFWSKTFPVDASIKTEPAE